MSNYSMTSIKLSKNIEMAMLQRVIAEEYGMRGKSKWIKESIEEILSLPNFPELVDIADELEHLEKVASIRFPDTMMLTIDEAVIKVRQSYPAMEGVRSKIIRAAILQKLIRKPTSVTEV